MIYLVAGYMFLFIFRPYEYWPALGELRIERVYMLVLMTLVFFWQGKRYIPHAVTRHLAVFLLAMTASAVFALNTSLAYEATFNLFKVAVFYVIIVLTVRTEEDLRKFLTAYLLIMLVYVGKSAWEFFLHDRHVYRMGIRRMVGVDVSYGDPNSFAASIVYSLPFLWALLRCRSAWTWVKPALGAYALLAAVAIVFTGSRSGMVTALFLLVLLWWRSHRKLAGAVILAVALVTIWAQMPAALKGRFLSTFGFSGGTVEEVWAEHSAQGRIAGLRQGAKLFREHPVLGIGPDNFVLGWDDPLIQMQAHNLYGQLLGELGAVGFGAFFVLVWAIYRTHRGNLRRIAELEAASPEGGGGEDLSFLRLVSAASVQTLLLLLFNGNFGHNLYRYNWLWIGAIGILASHFLAQRQGAGEEVREVLPAVALAAAERSG